MVKRINLALQGGGSHGAYTWGVLDRILEDDRLEIDGISGTSAGAMNGALVAEGLHQGGRQEAMNALHRFWAAISDSGRYSPLSMTWWDKLWGRWSLDHLPAYVWLDLVSRMASPYDLNPFNINPLKGILEKEIHFDRIHSCSAVRLYICATDVQTGRPRIFTNPHITLDVLLASACLPFMFQAPEIDGRHYWDGGYTGNPSLYPLFKCESRDVILVKINPIFREQIPRTSRDIINRVNEISFNNSLLHELRAIDFVTRLLDEEAIAPNRYKRMLIHLIDSDGELDPLGASSKFNTDWDFLRHLHDIGYRSADVWLDKHYQTLGKDSSVNVRETFL
jgi:NTE family protein